MGGRGSWESAFIDGDSGIALRTPEHERLLVRYGSAAAQSYSEVLLHCLLWTLPTTAYGCVEVHDAWTEGQWSIAVVFRQPAIVELIGCRTTVVQRAQGDRARFVKYGRPCAYPPEPRPVAEGVANWMTEPLGTDWDRLVRDSAGMAWAGGHRASGNLDTAMFGKDLSAAEVQEVQDRIVEIVELDLQLRAMDHLPASLDILESSMTWQERVQAMAGLLNTAVDDVGPVMELLPERMRAEDEDRLRHQRRWLATWGD